MEGKGDVLNGPLKRPKRHLTESVAIPILGGASQVLGTLNVIFQTKKNYEKKRYLSTRSN